MSDDSIEQHRDAHAQAREQRRMRLSTPLNGVSDDPGPAPKHNSTPIAVHEDAQPNANSAGG